MIAGHTIIYGQGPNSQTFIGFDLAMHYGLAGYTILKAAQSNLAIQRFNRWVAAWQRHYDTAGRIAAFTVLLPPDDRSHSGIVRRIIKEAAGRQPIILFDSSAGLGLPDWWVSPAIEIAATLCCPVLTVASLPASPPSAVPTDAADTIICCKEILHPSPQVILHFDKPSAPETILKATTAGEIITFDWPEILLKKEIAHERKQQPAIA